MGLNTFKFRINPDLELLDRLIAVERFDALWPDMERRSMNHLNTLKLKAINRSMGAVLRFEGFDFEEDKIEHFLKTSFLRRMIRESANIRRLYCCLQENCAESTKSRGE
ncbi:MAG: hypothetical protein IPI30_21285 [Saprospiraceae bacterium]|nr:hypothetical protein [Candidatus Vicinibacter affinis]